MTKLQTARNHTQNIAISGDLSQAMKDMTWAGWDALGGISERRIQALRKHGRPANNEKPYNHKVFNDDYGTGKPYILARLARDHPDILAGRWLARLTIAATQDVGGLADMGARYGREQMSEYFMKPCAIDQNAVYLLATKLFTGSRSAEAHVEAYRRPLRIGPVVKNYTARTYRDPLETDGDEAGLFCKGAML